MGIKYPTSDQITQDHRVLIVTLGGASASSGRDHVSTLADCFSTQGPYFDAGCLGVTGHPIGGGFPSGPIAEKLISIIERMRSRSGENPVVVFVGKSLGGCRLHKVSRIFNRPDRRVGIDLFIGIDMSCWPAKHYQSYMRRKKRFHGRIFTENVKQILNFYQTNDLLQTGHPALRYGVAELSREININVNKSPAIIDENGTVRRSPSYSPICPDADHMSIDTNPALIEGIKRIIWHQGIIGRTRRIIDRE